VEVVKGRVVVDDDVVGAWICSRHVRGAGGVLERDHERVARANGRAELRIGRTTRRRQEKGERDAEGGEQDHRHLYGKAG
jgi:hypothetical protein